MGAHRSVVKHSYLTGKDKGVARAQAHVRYIQFRGGKDKEEGTRSFFNDVRDEIYSGEVREAVSDQNPRGTVMHKLILSPGVQGADVKEYCREVMADLSSRKGLDLEWYGVQHENTDNPHVHIVVMGTDQNGHKVRLNKEDYTKIKEAGDRYLERNRLLDREEKDKEKDKDEKDRGDRNPAARFFDALKAAAREFSRTISKDEKGGKPESKFEQRKREKEEEKQKEVAALGETIDLDDYLAKQVEKEEREEARREKAWKEYCKPIEISRDGQEPAKYDRSSSLQSLRGLERDYRNDDALARAGMSEADAKRLNDWIKEKYRDEKRIETKAEKLESIDVELDSESKGKWTKGSSLEELRKLETLNARGEVYLDDAERTALANWVKDQELKEPVRIELEPGAEPMVYDKEDSKESLQFLAKEYEKGEHWATQGLSKAEYQKVKTWIKDKDRPKELDKEPGEKPEKEADRPLHVGKTKDGKDRYVSKNMDADTLRAARDDLKNGPDAKKEDLDRLDGWIDAREKEENKDPNKKPYQKRRKVTPRERLMQRAINQGKAERWNNYYKEKTEQRTRLEAEKANLQGQKRALNKYEKERETVDGQYSEIWGADKSALATTVKGASVGGLRPMGANQWVKLITQAKQNFEAKQRAAREDAAKTQKGLARQLEEDKKTQKPTEKNQEKDLKPVTEKPKDKGEKPASVDKEAAKEPEVKPVDNSKLETETRELGKDLKNKKKKEEDRDPHRKPDDDKGKESPFKRDPWGRW
jgi:hypothetical protein